MHTLHNWQVGGVDYIVTGNGASKYYVAHDQGDILGTGTITMKNGKTSFGFDPLLTKIYLKNSALYGDTINTVPGAALQLDLYGDFREYPANYLTQLNDDSLVNILWSSSDSSVASVDSKGSVHILKEGAAQISAVCGGKTTGINLVAKTLDDTKLVKLSLSLPEKITSGSSFIPTLTATDVNGNQVLLDHTKAQFTSQNGRIVLAGNGTLSAAAAGTDTVTAQYALTNGKTLTATATVSIEANYVPIYNSNSDSKTVTNADGSTTTEITKKDGSISTTTTRKDGIKTETLRSAAGETTAVVTMPGKGEKTVVEVPVKNLGPGAVAVIVHDDGTEEIVRKSILDGDKLRLSLEGSAKLKIVEKAITFSDISSGAWYSDAVSFAAAHELFKGTSEGRFSPNESTTRAMMFTVFYRLNGGENAASGSSWYGNALDWAVSQKISDGSSPDAPITRQQLVTILYRYAQASGLQCEEGADLSRFSDAGSLAAYAIEAMRWAVANSIIAGDNGGRLDSAGLATRSQVAAIVMQFEKTLLGAKQSQSARY